MKINKLNYENFVIDYIEGNLNSDQKEAFDFFIQDHPEVYEEIKDFISAPILKEDTSITFENKKVLFNKAPSYSLIWVLFPILLLGTGFLFFNQTNKDVEQPVENLEINTPLANAPKVEDETEEFAPGIDAIEIESEDITVEPLVESIAEVVFTEPLSGQSGHTIKPLKVEPVELEPAITNTVKPEVRSETIVVETYPRNDAILVVEDGVDSDIEREALNRVLLLVQEPTGLSLAERQENISMNFSNKVILEKRDRNWKDLKEVFTTKAYKDVDFKEALTSESATEFMKERKFLKSFIPETFTKK